MAPLISIVIPTLHSPHIAETVRRLPLQTRYDCIKEIIVVGAEDTADWMDIPKVSFIYNKNQPSPAANRNIGANTATGDWIFFLDSDCEPDTHWIAEIVNHLEDSYLSIAGSVDIPPRTTFWGQCDHYLTFEKLVRKFPYKPAKTKYAATLNFGIERNLFENLNGFDESFTRAAGEDWEFAFRLRQIGYPILLIPDAVVIHHHARTTLRSAWMHCQMYGSATYRLWKMHRKSVYWQLASFLMRIPIIREMGVFIRLSFRGICRPFRQPYLLKKPWLLFGMLVLDLAHSYGILLGALDGKG